MSGTTSRPRASAAAGHDGFRAALLAWWPNEREERDRLPWRGTRDPWLTLMAETMLAQTGVGRVAPRFAEIAARFPTPTECHLAPVGDLLRLWTGLGYNRRAVALHAAAGVIVDEHGGVVPDNIEDLLALPGVGPYTARAVAAFAFGQATGVVDTNIARVLARAVAGRTLTRNEAQVLADGLVDAAAPREWNLALMDFGHLVCRARTPQCATCPLVERCAWRIGAPRTDPAVGSAHVSRPQAAFAGSDREGRGRLVRAACDAPVPSSSLAVVAGWPEDEPRAARVAAALVKEGILVFDGPSRSYRLT